MKVEIPVEAIANPFPATVLSPANALASCKASPTAASVFFLASASASATDLLAAAYFLFMNKICSAVKPAADIVNEIIEEYNMMLEIVKGGKFDM